MHNRNSAGARLDAQRGAANLNTAQNKTPLDPTTARVVSELSEQLLPPLLDALNKTVGTEQLTQIIAQIFSDNNIEIKSEIKNNIKNEIKNSLNAANNELASMRQRLNKMGESIDALLNLYSSLSLSAASGNNKNAGLSQSVLDGLYSLSVQLGDFREAQRDIKSHGQIINQLKIAFDNFSDKLNALGSLDKNKINNNLEKNLEKLEKLDKLDKIDKLGNFDNNNLDNLDKFEKLEGLLRAQGHAQSRELEALSRELSTMQNQTSAAMIQTLQETARQEAVERDAEWEDRLETEHEFIESKIKNFSKILWLVIILCGGAFILSFIKLF